MFHRHRCLQDQGQGQDHGQEQGQGQDHGQDRGQGQHQERESYYKPDEEDALRDLNNIFQDICQQGLNEEWDFPLLATFQEDIVFSPRNEATSSPIDYVSDVSGVFSPRSATTDTSHGMYFSEQTGEGSQGEGSCSGVWQPGLPETH